MLHTHIRMHTQAESNKRVQTVKFVQKSNSILVQLFNLIFANRKTFIPIEWHMRNNIIALTRFRLNVFTVLGPCARFDRALYVW